jgi:hypothetical protein
MTTNPFDTDLPPRRRRWPRWTLAVIVAAAAVIACSLAWWPEAPKPPDRSCGHAATGHRKTIGGECVGWSDGDGDPFSADLGPVTAQIRAANADVDKRAREHHIRYVRVAVMMPLTSSPDSSLDAKAIRHSLQGAYVAQVRANTTTDFESATVLVKLVLMNEGRYQSHWDALVPALKRLRDDKQHPLVAAIGLGVSHQRTLASAVKLDELGIPAVGAMLTAVTAPGLYQVAPSNGDYVSALATYLTGHQKLATAIEVVDQNGEGHNGDLYVAAMHREFSRPALAKYIKGTVRFVGSMNADRAVPDVFDDVKRGICATHAGLVFYGGRPRDLPALITTLADGFHCAPGPVTILTGANGVTLKPADRANLRTARTSVVIASASDPGSWAAGKGAPDGYADFARRIPKDLQAGELTDGYVIGHHDALAVVATALHRFGTDSDHVPSAKDLATRLANANGDNPGLRIHAAGGSLYFPPGGHGWPCGKTVPLTISTGSGSDALPSPVTCSPAPDRP